MKDFQTINEKLRIGDLDDPGLFPHLTRLNEIPFVFDIDFGLQTLPKEPGILLIRGPRQYGKSTWLEHQLKSSIEEFGAGSAFYLNGENILVADKLEQEIEVVLSVFGKDVHIRRIFIDEITAIPDWEIVLKRMVDRGDLAKVLIVTTGSSATDLRRGTEKLPGRKGKYDRTDYLFTPLAYKEFKRVCGKKIGAQHKILISYLISGGSPIACSELAAFGRIPEYIVQLVREWVDGEIARSGRLRSSLYSIMTVLYKFGGTPVGQAKLARETGLANNTVAQGYIELLNDLGCVIPSYPWDQDRKNIIKRKECKYHFTNLLVAIVYHAERIRSVEDFESLSEKAQSIWFEWLVAQELNRRRSISGENLLEPLAFWQNKQHEIDFVLSDKQYLEVKRCNVSPIEMAWFVKQFPASHLTVINKKSFETDKMLGYTLEEFLLNDSSES